VSLRRVYAIAAKEAQDLRTNTNILIMYPVPVLIALIYARLIPAVPVSFAVAFGIMFMVVLGGIYIPAMMIAEEKEKNTLGVLMLSPATPLEVFVGKGIITFASILVVSMIMMVVVGTGFVRLDVVLPAVSLGTIFAIFLGMTVGIYSKNQMATGAIGMPAYLVLLLIPFLGMENAAIGRIARYVPTYHLLRALMMALRDGTSILGAVSELLVLFGSCAAALTLLLAAYRWKGLE